MLIGFIGDVHGQVFHMLAAVTTWQQQTGRTFDLLIQVGDMGAFPDPARMDAASARYLATEPSQADFSRLLPMKGVGAERLRALRRSLASPIYFIRGNHEDTAWLRQLPRDSATGTASVDFCDLLRYVPDGTVLRLGGSRLPAWAASRARTRERRRRRPLIRSPIAPCWSGGRARPISW